MSGGGTTKWPLSGVGCSHSLDSCKSYVMLCTVRWFGSIAVMDDQQRERCRASCEAMAAGAIAAARALADGETRPDQPDQQVVEALKALATAQTTLTETQRALINAALDAGVSVRRTAAAAGRPVVTVQKWRKDAKESD